MVRATDSAGSRRANRVGLGNHPENKCRPNQSQGTRVGRVSSTPGVLHLGKFLHRNILPAVSPSPRSFKHLGLAKLARRNSRGLGEGCGTADCRCKLFVVTSNNILEVTSHGEQKISVVIGMPEGYWNLIDEETTTRL